MLRTSDSETEILLGNKQLLGIFFVVAILLGIAFYGGYMVGKAAPGKPAASQDTASSSTPSNNSSPGQTHTLSPDSGADVNPTDATEPQPSVPAQQPLGTPKTRKALSETASRPVEPREAQSLTSFNPQPGQEFLQVAAVQRDEALAVADVLHAKGFRAHAVPKPGSSKIYRVLIGPVRDAGDLSTTRDALRQTGFGKVIVQKY